MKTLLSIILASALAVSAAEPLPSLSIKGDMNVQFSTQVNIGTEESPKIVMANRYTLNINALGTMLFTGTIDRLGTKSGALIYKLDCVLVNANDPNKTRNIGNLVGSVPIDASNAYRFADGDLKISVFAVGAGEGLSSKFNGLALGKPPAKEVSWWETAKQESLNLIGQNKGKPTSLKVTKYDKMEFQSHVLAAGPAPVYPQVTVNGVLIYDYNREAWLFNNVLATYFVNRVQSQDTLTGNIRWVKAKDYAVSGNSEYQFDIRVNEPPPNEMEMGASNEAQDESAYWVEDETVPSLTGVVKFHDDKKGGSVSASKVTIDLVSNKLTRQQTMYLFKLLFISSIVPLNSD